MLWTRNESVLVKLDDGLSEMTAKLLPFSLYWRKMVTSFRFNWTFCYGLLPSNSSFVWLLFFFFFFDYFQFLYNSLRGPYLLNSLPSFVSSFQPFLFIFIPKFVWEILSFTLSFYVANIYFNIRFLALGCPFLGLFVVRSLTARFCEFHDLLFHDL